MPQKNSVSLQVAVSAEVNLYNLSVRQQSSSEKDNSSFS